MNIIGIIVILTLPYVAGYILKNILNMKETSQIETYLTGFFFVFLLQGLVFNVGYNVLHHSFAQICMDYNYMMVAMAALLIVAVIVDIAKRLRKGKKAEVYHAKYHYGDWILLAVTLAIFAIIVIRIVRLEDYLRMDLMLPTVRTTMSTGTVYEYNPIISEPFTLGLVMSKKIIALPIYYSYLCVNYGIEETFLLYIVLTVQTVMCTYFACMKFIVPVIRNRRRSLIFSVFLGAVILSGDYYSGALGEKLLWNGYAGETIVATVMLPYILYVVTSWYRHERGDQGEKSMAIRVQNVGKILLCFFASVFITSIPTGLLMLVIETVIIGVSSLVRFRIQEGKA